MFGGQTPEGMDAQQVTQTINLPQSQMSGSRIVIDVEAIPSSVRGIWQA